MTSAGMHNFDRFRTSVVAVREAYYRTYGAEKFLAATWCATPWDCDKIGHWLWPTGVCRP